MYQIDNYSVTSKSDPYLPPELAHKQIQGQVKNHPAYKDGTKIITSDIIAVNGRVVKTANSEYELLTPDPKWLDWMKERDIKFDPERPIRVRAT